MSRREYGNASGRQTWDTNTEVLPVRQLTAESMGVKSVLYKTHGTCSQSIQIEVDRERNTVTSVEFDRGCPGNTAGVAKLVAGRDIDEVIRLLEGTPCGKRGTSCPDQLAKALRLAKEDISVSKAEEKDGI